MALTSANFYNLGFSNFPLSSLTENEDCFLDHMRSNGKKYWHLCSDARGHFSGSYQSKRKKNLMSLLLLT